MHVRILPLFAILLTISGCIHIKMDPIEVNANVNVNVRLEKALDDFFGDLDAQSATISNPPTEQTN